MLEPTKPTAKSCSLACSSPVLSRLVPLSQAMLSDCRTLDSSDGGLKRYNWQDIFMELESKQTKAIREGEGFWKALPGTGDGGQPEPTT